MVTYSNFCISIFSLLLFVFLSAHSNAQTTINFSDQNWSQHELDYPRIAKIPVPNNSIKEVFDVPKSVNHFLIKKITPEFASPVPGTMEFGAATNVLISATNPSIDQSIDVLLNGFDASMTTSTNARLIAFARSANGFGTDQTAGPTDAALVFGGDFIGSTNSSTLSTDSGDEIGITSFDFAYEVGGGAPVVLTFIASGKKNGVEVGTKMISVAHNTLINVDLTSPTTGSFADIDQLVLTPSAPLKGGWSMDTMVIVAAAVADSSPPVFDSTPSSSAITQTGFTLAADIDEAGTIYYVIVADGATAPTSANVKAGQSSGAGTPVTSGNAAVSTGGFSNNFSVISLSAGTAYDVYVVAQDDEGTPNLQTFPTKIDVTTAAPTSLLVAAAVFPEGAYNGTNLNTTINGSIPTTQPYSNNGHSGGTAGSIPAGAVDWVLVELREAGSAAGALNSTRKGSTAGFLMNDGTIKATDGTSNLTVSLSSNTGADYYVVIYHRNHLPIMSASAIAGSSGTLTIDFTSSSANTYQTTTALVSLSGGKFGMPAGDSSGDGLIDATDLSTWRTNNGVVFSYSGNGVVDFNLDGVINAVDRNGFHQKNTAKISQVPST